MYNHLGSDLRHMSLPTSTSVGLAVLTKNRFTKSMSLRSEPFTIRSGLSLAEAMRANKTGQRLTGQSRQRNADRQRLYSATYARIVMLLSCCSKLAVTSKDAIAFSTLPGTTSSGAPKEKERSGDHEPNPQ